MPHLQSLDVQCCSKSPQPIKTSSCCIQMPTSRPYVVIHMPTMSSYTICSCLRGSDDPGTHCLWPKANQELRQNVVGTERFAAHGQFFPASQNADGVSARRPCTMHMIIGFRVPDLCQDTFYPAAKSDWIRSIGTPKVTWKICHTRDAVPDSWSGGGKPLHCRVERL